MKIIITKKQYKLLVYSLLDTITGGELTVQKLSTANYKSVYDSEGENIMDIFSKKGSGRNKGCKNDLTLEDDFLIELQKYVPYFKHKMFSRALVDYVYEKTGIKCDCVDYSTDYRVDDNNGEEYGYFNSRFAYNVKKKKKVRFDESVDGRQSLDEIIYDFLKDDFYPDYDWGPELFDFYREDVEKYGSIAFYINDSEGYVYYDDGTLEIMPWVCKKLNDYFNDLWVPVFKGWFEEHSGLKVDRIVDSSDNNVLLRESVNNSNVVEQIMEVEGIKLDSFGYGGRTRDSFMRKHDSVDVYFKLTNDDYYYKRRIHFLTRNNKVIGVDSAGDFRTITDGFRYIPTEVLMPYFIEKAKTYLERILPYEYPNDNK
jgi:hypothetical protein